jgi:hypothetical protein
LCIYLCWEGVLTKWRLDVLDLFHILALKLFKNKIYWKIDNKKQIALPRSTEDKDIFGQLTMFYLCLGIHQVTNVTYYYYHGTGKSRSPMLHITTTMEQVSLYCIYILQFKSPKSVLYFLTDWRVWEVRDECRNNSTNKGNNKITELRTIFQRESQNS